VPRHDDDFDDSKPIRRLRVLPEDDDAPSYSTWSVATQGPAPHPAWVVTAAAAIDTDRGVLKTGKEADVHLLERSVPGGPTCLLAAKRYRTAERRMFHRDAAYQEGRRVRRSRETRAMARRTEFGRELLAGQWAIAEFSALGALWELGVRVPYPVQLLGTELLLEFIGAPSGQAAPRLAQCRLSKDAAADLFEQCRRAMTTMAAAGWAHGDLSAYNLLVDDDRLVLIDLPQIVDIVTNPQGPDFLHRDCANICTWFAGHGHPAADVDELFADLMAAAAARW
jgi:RIO kinase 1